MIWFAKVSAPVMRTKILTGLIVFISSVVLSGYIYLSVYAVRPLTPSEYMKFSSTILFAAVLHSNDKGGARALELAKEALSSAPKIGVEDVDGRRYQFPLPKYSVRREGHENSYLVFASDKELEDYFDKTLPQAGWKYFDRMGGLHIYMNDDGVILTVGQSFYLGTGISSLGGSISKSSLPPVNKPLL